MPWAMPTTWIPRLATPHQHSPCALRRGGPTVPLLHGARIGSRAGAATLEDAMERSVQRRTRLRLSILAAVPLAVLTAVPAAASAPGADARLTNDSPATSGYVSNYTATTGLAYTDATLTECSRARGRQNEPSVAVDPRNANVLVGSSNDYCGTYNDGSDADGAPLPVGPIWLGYYRSENGGANFQSSLVPGYPGDTSPYAALAKIRTASAGDPVIAWDNHGRLFMGSESSDDPSGSKKTFGDVWVARFDNPNASGQPTTDDGKRFLGSTI